MNFSSLPDTEKGPKNNWVSIDERFLVLVPCHWRVSQGDDGSGKMLSSGAATSPTKNHIISIDNGGCRPPHPRLVFSPQIFTRLPG